MTLLVEPHFKGSYVPSFICISFTIYITTHLYGFFFNNMKKQGVIKSLKNPMEAEHHA